MKVTRVNLRTDLVERIGSRLLACGSVELDCELRIEYVRVVKTMDGRLLVAMPSRVNNAGMHRDTVHPITGRLRAEIDAAVLAEYRKGLTGTDEGVTIPQVNGER